MSNLNSNVKLGHGDIVVEADEYDRSFLALNPTIAIITNLEMEHTDCYANIEELKSAFYNFVIQYHSMEKSYYVQILTFNETIK